MNENPNFDETDEMILTALQNNARQSNVELARAARIAPSTSLERLRRLESRSIITGYHAETNLKAVGRSVQALISIRIRPPARTVIEEFTNWARQQKETIGLFVVSGESDFLIHVAVKDSDALYSFVTDSLTKRSEVAHVNTSVVYRHFQNHAVSPSGN